MQTFFRRNEKKIAGIAFLAVFLGLIRSLSEPFRLQYYSVTTMTFEQIQPFLIGSIVAATGLWLMGILLYYSRFRFIPLIAILTIMAMMIVKFSFHV